MPRGRVYLWLPDQESAVGGRVSAGVVSLPHLEMPEMGEDGARLCGRFVRVRNGGAVNVPDPVTGTARATPIGDARPNADGDFLFEPGRGGGRLDKVVLAEPDVRWRYVQAAHFGEVNTYFHLDRLATYVDGLLRDLGVPSLPPVVAVVNAHHAATEHDGIRDGVRRGERWLPFQGGHYRLPSRRQEIVEYVPVALAGEIHLGPGWQLLEHGALVEAAGWRYQANASHNAGILYHEYGHHIARHTADFQTNAWRRPNRQHNRKSAIDEGTCDYWAATMLGTPHIWAWHRLHTDTEFHPRSLASAKTMADFDAGPRADPHANGTIWGAALWDLRTHLCALDPDGARNADLLVLKAFVLLGELANRRRARGGARGPMARERQDDFALGAAALLRADALLFDRAYRGPMLTALEKRGMVPACNVDWGESAVGATTSGKGDEREKPSPSATAMSVAPLLKHVAAEELPDSDDVLAAAALERVLSRRGEPALSVIVAGDIMLGGRTRRAIARHGADYPLAALAPLFRRSAITLGNLEGPFAREARREPRVFSYRVDPDLAGALARSGLTVMTLANNHLLDCGRAGVIETLAALAAAGIAPLGAGANTTAAHEPVIRRAGPWQIGLLGYYWNARCAARADQPGSAMDTYEMLERDIRSLRQQVDRVVVTFHWGVPYEREPQDDVRAKARFAVECGADAVIGHHPHVAQPFEVYRHRPIFYSCGNCAFGSGNSRAEGLLVGLGFDAQRTRVRVYPLYVKNRDLRVDYQPKVLTGASAERELRRLKEISGASGELLAIADGWGSLDLPYAAERTAFVAAERTEGARW